MVESCYVEAIDRSDVPARRKQESIVVRAVQKGYDGEGRPRGKI